MIFRLDPEGNYLLVSPVVEQLAGYKPEEFYADRTFVHRIVVPEDVEKMKGGFREASSGEVSRDVEYRVRRRGGGTLWVSQNTFPVQDSEGHVVAIEGTLRDISDRKRAEEALRESQEARYRLLLESVSDGVYVLDREWRYVMANDAVEQIVHMPKEKLQGRLIDLFPGIEETSLFRTYRQVMETREPSVHSDEYVYEDGGRGWYEAHVYPAPEGILVIATDITERKRAEEQREHYAAELERSNRELQQFAYVASHDLQEPLRMVASYLQLLERRYKGQLDTDADEFIGYAVDGASRMQTLLHDLLAYSRVGTHGKAFEPTDCQAILNQTLMNLKVAIEESSAQVTCDDLPTVIVDGTQLGQVFQNLIGNAIKFRRNKRPEVHVGAVQRDGDWTFSVRDNGIGIDSKYAERIFLIFQRLHDREMYSGTGVGLAICKKIMERHGGRIWMESEPGAGSTFYFTLPDRQVG